MPAYSEFMEQLTDAALKVGVNLTSAQQAQFQRYFHALESANAKFNLTGVRGWERVRDELLIRSMRLLTPALGDGVLASGWLDGKSVLDVGSGAGIPGLVFKILCPSASVTLLDSSAKKTGFLREVIDDLALIDVTVLRGRAEEFGQNNEHRERYDLVVARGVAKLPELAELTLPFAVVGGAVISAKGPDIAGEIEQAAYAASLLGAAPALSHRVDTPGNSPPDTLVYWLKIGPTPAEYPRRNGVPGTSPLVRREIAGSARP